MTTVNLTHIVAAPLLADRQRGGRGRQCRRLKLPSLPALVVRADTRRPGDAYFVNGKETTRWERIAAWKREVEEVRRARYPRPPHHSFPESQ